MITEDGLEQLCLTWFQDAGWSFQHGPDIAPDSTNPARKDWRDVLIDFHFGNGELIEASGDGEAHVIKLEQVNH